MGKVDFKKLIIAGIAGAATLAAVNLLAPLFGLRPEQNIDRLLAIQADLPEIVRWTAHFISGIFITWIYAAFLIDRLPSDGWKRGMIFSLIPWVMFNFTAMGMLGAGMGVFSFGMMAVTMTLIAHLAYGAVVGTLYTGETSSDTAAEPAASTPEPTTEPVATPDPEPTPEPEAPAEEDSSSESEGDSEGGDDSEETNEEE